MHERHQHFLQNGSPIFCLSTRLRERAGISETSAGVSHCTSDLLSLLVRYANGDHGIKPALKADKLLFSTVHSALGFVVSLLAEQQLPLMNIDMRVSLLAERKIEMTQNVSTYKTSQIAL